MSKSELKEFVKSQRRVDEESKKKLANIKERQVLTEKRAREIKLGSS